MRAADLLAARGSPPCPTSPAARRRRAARGVTRPSLRGARPSTCRAMFDGIAKPMPMLPSDRREDLRVDADQLALRVHQRAARVAVVDRRVGLQEVLVARRRPTPVDRPFALMIPIVTVWPTPSGLPTASTTSPTCTSSELPSASGLEIGGVDLHQREIARLVGADQLRRRACGRPSARRGCRPRRRRRGCWSGCSRRSLTITPEPSAALPEAARHARAAAAAGPSPTGRRRSGGRSRRRRTGTASGETFALPSTRIVTTAGATTLTMSAYESRAAGNRVGDRCGVDGAATGDRRRWLRAAAPTAAPRRAPLPGSAADQDDRGRAAEPVRCETETSSAHGGCPSFHRRPVL